MSILSLYFLAASSPSKGDVFGSEVSVCINPLALRALPLYRYATQGEGINSDFTKKAQSFQIAHQRIYCKSKYKESCEI